MPTGSFWVWVCIGWVDSQASMRGQERSSEVSVPARLWLRRPSRCAALASLISAQPRFTLAFFQYARWRMVARLEAECEGGHPNEGRNQELDYAEPAIN